MSGRRGTTNATSSTPTTTSNNARLRNNTNSSSSSSNKAFNPRLIFSQIVAMQCFHYLFLGFLFQVNHVLFGTTITIDRMFTSDYVKIRHVDGWADVFAFLLSSLFGSVLMAIIVEKAKKCLDFSFTLFMIHLFFCVCYNGFPSTWDWYIVHVVGTVIMVLFGEYICSRRELDDIPLLQL